MRYKEVVLAKFIDRPNRFVSTCEINGELVKVHVKNTGRCKELLINGVTVILEDFINHMGKRKYRYDLISVYKKDMLINMDSQAPNKVVFEALQQGKLKLEGFGHLTKIIPEYTFFSSRFDFFIEDDLGNKGFIEVKGVTLENDGICSFPDAPTIRGTKHVNELIKAKEMGYISNILFVIQMDNMKELRPNASHDIEFTNALRMASGNGVNVIAYSCKVTEDTLEIYKEIKVNLNEEA